MSAKKRAFVPFPKLAQSNFHHGELGSSHREQPDTPENHHKPKHEFMSDEKLNEYVRDEISSLREEYAELEEAQIEDDRQRQKKIIRVLREKFVMPNLRYLEAIGRLPEDIRVTEVEKEFPPID